MLNRRSQLDGVTRRILSQEEKHGMAFTNRVRFIFILFIAGPAVYMSFKSGIRAGLISNSIAVLSYLCITLVHYIIIKKDNEKLTSLFSYIALVFDAAIIFFLVIFWTTAYTDNWAFALKTPLWYYYIFLMILPVLQFRARLVFFFLGLFLLLYYGTVVYAAVSGVTFSYNWYDYVMGDHLILTDVLFARPIIFSLSAVLIWYTIHRALAMVNQIGQREAERSSLARYFSPKVVDNITRDPSRMKHGQRQPVTVLFLDIRNFTDISERIEADQLVEWLGDFRARMTAIVFQHGGTLDKFIGDAILATFGTPEVSEDPDSDSYAALSAARAMALEASKINHDYLNRGIKTRIGIGLHCGEAFAGSVGSAGQLEFTVIGDVVNTASRIESLTKKLEQTILLSNDVKQAVLRHINITSKGAQPAMPGETTFKKMPLVKVKGKSEPLKLWSIDIK